MNVIFALPRCSPRPSWSWSVMRTYCSLSEGLGDGGPVDPNFTPKKKKRKKAQPRQVDPSVFDASNRPDWKLVSSVAANLRRQTPLRTRSGPRCSTPPDDVTSEIGGHIDRFCKETGLTTDDLLFGGKKFFQHFRGRKPPMERSAKNKLKYNETKAAEQRLMAELTDEPSNEELEEVKSSAEKKAENWLKKTTSHWKQIIYNETSVHSYLLGKAPYDYATARSVMSHLKLENKDFQPKTMLDFGTGVGAALWAAQDTFGQMDEVFAVEPSAPMNTLAKAVATKRKMTVFESGSSFRLRLPADAELKYDLVTCSHTLMDLPSALARVTALDSLWRRTAVGGHLVIIEIGTNAGFQLISEARNYLLQLCRVDTGTEEDAEINGHVTMPCPHLNRCPRYHLDTYPCNFDVKYKTFQLAALPHETREAVHMDKFSYLVLKKGPKHQSSSCKFPRLVEQPIVKPKNGHTICRLCTSRGMLEEVLVKKKSGIMYDYVSRSSCGDKLMVHLSDPVPVTDDGEENMKIDKTEE